MYPIQDFPKQKIIQYFDETHEWINKMYQEGRNILIHCAAGVSRSTSFVIAYIMKEKKMPYHEAYQLVKEKRKWANPNSGFREQLIDYNAKLGLAPPPLEYQPPSYWMN